MNFQSKTRDLSFLLPFAAIFLATGFLAACSTQPAPPPNILFIFADDHASAAISAYGSTVNQTPNIDRLAKEGILFEHAYISSPSCTPSRNAILTGQYHWRLDTGANLYGANLAYANLTNANLTNANLTDANLTNAILTDAEFCNTTMPDGSIDNSDC